MTVLSRPNALAIAALASLLLAACTAESRARVDSAKADSTSVAPAAGAAGVNADANATPRVPRDGAHGPASNVVSFAGAAPLRIGMSAVEARQALGLPAANAKPGQCSYLDPKGRLHAFAMMVRDTVARIDVRDSSLATDTGVRVGDTESRVLDAYRGRVTTEPHKYVRGGHYLVVTSPADTTRQLVFETDGKRVTQFRVGRLPEVRWVEGCG